MAKIVIKCESKDILEILSNLSLLPNKEIALSLEITDSKNNFNYLCTGTPIKNWHFWGEKEKKVENPKSEPKIEENSKEDKETAESPYWKISSPENFEETINAIRLVKKTYPAVRVKSNTWNLLFDQAKLSVRKDIPDSLSKLGTDLYPKAIEMGTDIDGLIGRIIYIISGNPTASDQDIINELYGEE